MHPGSGGSGSSGNVQRWRRITTAFFLAALSLPGLAERGADGKPRQPAKAPPPAAKTPEPPKPALKLPTVSVAAEEVRRHARALAAIATDSALNDSERGQRTQKYIAEQLYESGLAPGGDGEHGTAGFAQAVALQGQRSGLRGRPRFVGTSTTVPVQITVAPRELVLFSALPQPEVTVTESELLFLGYGITAAERGWDDYKGIDVRGKTVLLLDGMPRELAAAGPALRGAARYPQKFAEAQRRGATGALLIHNQDRAEHSLDALRAYFGSERRLAPLPRDGTALQVAGYVHDEAARRLLQAGGQDLEAQQQAAESREFTPLSLRVRMTAQVQNQTRSLDAANLVGILAGADEEARGEAVVISTHVDHLSTIADGAGGQLTLPGVRERLLGVAGLLALAQATRQQPPPRRSLIFAVLSGHSEAFVGAQRLLKRLPSPAQRVVAQLNLDALSGGDGSAQIVQIGRGKSTLDELLDQAAAVAARTVMSEGQPGRGLLYRSDSLTFARAGIPVLFLAPPDLDQYLASDYLRPSDTLRDAFTFVGAAADCSFVYQLGWLIGNARTLPYYLPGDEFAPRGTPAAATAP